VPGDEKSPSVYSHLAGDAGADCRKRGKCPSNAKENVQLRIDTEILITACDLSSDGTLSDSELELYKYCVEVHHADQQNVRQSATGPRNLTPQEALKALSDFRLSFDIDGSGTLEPTEIRAMHEKVRTTTVNNFLSLAEAKRAKKSG
jgi:hypothetical protein